MLKKMLVVAVLSGGCTSTYEYRQVDDWESNLDYDSRTVTTTASQINTKERDCRAWIRGRPFCSDAEHASDKQTESKDLGSIRNEALVEP